MDNENGKIELNENDQSQQQNPEQEKQLQEQQANEEKIADEKVQEEVAAGGEVQKETADGEAQEETVSEEAQKETASGEVQEETADEEAQEETASGEAQKETADGEAQEEMASGEAQKETASEEAQKETASEEVQKETADEEVQKETADEEAQKEVAAGEQLQEKVTDDKPDVEQTQQASKRQQIMPQQFQKTETQQMPQSGQQILQQPMQQLPQSAQQSPQSIQQSSQPMQPQLSPDAEEFFNGGVDELAKMLENVTRRDVLVSEIKNLASEGKKLEKQLADEKKNLEADLSKTVEEEREKFISEEDKVINDGSSELKKVKSERNKAKERGVRERIDNETAELVAENKSTRRYIRKTLKENGLPTYCDSKWFYALYCTQSFLEWIVKIFVFVLGLVLIPWLVVEIVDPWFFLKFILWVVVVVVFIAIYMTIFLLTKDRDNGTLEDMREYRDKIDDNNKAIKKIKKSIKTDTDESHYNLDKYDSKLSELQSSIENAAAAKDKKLKEFEEHKKQQIMNSVNAKHVPIIESRQREINDKAALYKSKNDEFVKLNKLIEEKYEKYLTKSYTNANCINNMIQIINNNGASNIGEAYSVVKNKK